MIAVLGGDGSGKSTAVHDLHAWISKDLDVIKVHLGKPPLSWTTHAFKISLKSLQFLRAPFKPKSHVISGSRRDGDSSQAQGYAHVVRQLCVGRDRFRAYVRARKFATNGSIVICDRFPLPAIRLMDGPAVERLPDDVPVNRFMRFLLRLESRYYQFIAPPDVAAVLRVHPDIAVQRKTDEDPEHVRSRSQEVWGCDWGQTNAHVIDASRPREQVLAELKSIVWSAL